MKNIIIGAGPAGIQMAYFLKDEDYIVLEKADAPCSFFRKFPRQRRFISLNKSRLMRFDWNSFIGNLSFRDYSDELYPSADDYVRYAEDFVKLNDIQIKYNYEVTSIDKRDDGLFYINGGEYIGERVFFGIGVVPKEPNIPVAPSIKVFTYQNMPLDKEIYRDKRVWVVGYGNAALEMIDWLDSVPKKVIVWGKERSAWQSHYPGFARTKNMTALDSYFQKAQTVFLFTRSSPVFTDSWSYNKMKQSLLVEEPVYGMADIVIFCTGFKFDGRLVKDLVDIDKFPILTAQYESPKCPNLFFIGANSQHEDYRYGSSAFVAGFRFNCEYVARHLKGQVTPMKLTKPEMIDMVFNQLNKSAALLHRFDLFCDLVGIGCDGYYYYIKEIPVSARDKYYDHSCWSEYFTLRLGYNPNQKFDDCFNQPTFVWPKYANMTRFIHPIFQNDNHILHLNENPFNEFAFRDIHIQPFLYFLDFLEGKLTEQQSLEKVNSIESFGEKIQKYLYDP
jgi:thioredoxin reductase